MPIARTVKRTYGQFIRPTIDLYYFQKGFQKHIFVPSYNTPVWSPHSIGLIINIKDVQRKFTRKLHAFKNTDYHFRSKLLDLKLLKQDLVWCYNILHGNDVDC